MQQKKAAKSESEQRELIAEMRASGKTQVAWCKEHDINPKTLGNWIRKYNQLDRKTSASFVKAGVARPAGAVPDTPSVCIQIGTYTITMDKEFDTVTIKSQVQTL